MFKQLRFRRFFWSEEYNNNAAAWVVRVGCTQYAYGFYRIYYEMSICSKCLQIPSWKYSSNVYFNRREWECWVVEWVIVSTGKYLGILNWSVNNITLNARNSNRSDVNCTLGQSLYFRPTRCDCRRIVFDRMIFTWRIQNNRFGLPCLHATP